MLRSQKLPLRHTVLYFHKNVILLFPLALGYIGHDPSKLTIVVLNNVRVSPNQSILQCRQRSSLFVPLLIQIQWFDDVDACSGF